MDLMNYCHVDGYISFLSRLCRLDVRHQVLLVLAHVLFEIRENINNYAQRFCCMLLFIQATAFSMVFKKWMHWTKSALILFVREKIAKLDWNTF